MYIVYTLYTMPVGIQAYASSPPFILYIGLLNLCREFVGEYLWDL